jgi:hypothetical protein
MFYTRNQEIQDFFTLLGDSAPRLDVVSTRTMRTLLLCMYGQSVANLICQPTCDVLWNDSMSGVPLYRIRFYR